MRVPVPLALLALAALALGATGPASRAGEGAGRPGEVELSDGSVVRGLVRFTEGRELRLQAGGATSRTHRIDPAQVVLLEMRVAGERMERPWRFENPGDPTKTYGEGEYPLRDLECRIVLRDGRTLEGALLSTPVYVRPDGAEEETRFGLVRQQKGEVGQTMDDLVHVRFVRFLDEDPGSFRPASIRGRLATPDLLEDLVLFHRESGRILRGAVLDAKEGAFLVRGLPPGTFDLLLETEETWWHGLPPLPAERPEGEAGLVLADREAVQAATAQAKDLFETREVVALGGTLDAAFALVVLDREGGTSYETELEGAKLWRLDVWLWHRLEREWRLDRRLFAFRGTREPGAAARRPRFLAALGGLAVEPGGTLDLGTLSPGADR